MNAPALTLPSQFAMTGMARLLCLSLLTAALLTMSGGSHAQPAKPAATASSSAAAKPAAAASRPTVSKPYWTELTPTQQETLRPLAASWSGLSEAHKKKWLEISRNYPSLPPEGQATMHGRMSEWAALSPQQRSEARLNFAKTKELSKQLTPEEKKARWQAYQALSPEEKQKLAARAAPRTVGAAPAIKPVAPQKLAPVQPHGTKPDGKAAPKIVSAPVAAASSATGVASNLPPAPPHN